MINFVICIGLFYMDIQYLFVVQVLKNINVDLKSQFVFFQNIDSLEVLKYSLLEPLRNQKC